MVPHVLTCSVSTSAAPSDVVRLTDPGSASDRSGRRGQGHGKGCVGELGSEGELRTEGALRSDSTESARPFLPSPSILTSSVSRRVPHVWANGKQDVSLPSKHTGQRKINRPIQYGVVGAREGHLTQQVGRLTCTGQGGVRRVGKGVPGGGRNLRRCLEPIGLNRSAWTPVMPSQQGRERGLWLEGRIHPKGRLGPACGGS